MRFGITTSTKMPTCIVGFTSGTTESINRVAHGWGGKFLRTGDVVLLTEMEHHSNLVPWQLLAERMGARLRFVSVRDDGRLALDQLPSLLTPEVKLFAFTHISNSLGTINPVAELWKKARSRKPPTDLKPARPTSPARLGSPPLSITSSGSGVRQFSNTTHILLVMRRTVSRNCPECVFSDQPTSVAHSSVLSWKQLTRMTLQRSRISTD